MNTAQKSTINAEEIDRFSKNSDQWWDEGGPFKPLHRLNPVRIQYLKNQICDHFNIDQDKTLPFKGLDILDIGCGGGLVCEPMARLGAKITGIDADQKAITCAKNHAEAQNLDVEYRCGDAADLKQKYDVVLALEIIEHVDNLGDFVALCKKLLKPEGLLVFSTLNRTAKSYALGIIAAEYILRWVPAGTHNWKKFIKPSEIARYARTEKLEIKDISGLVFNPFKNEFFLSDNDLDVNYFIALRS
ncbi:MAG: bifunctional 2-polyprenyl-6-hydroxyphenol methylase/3-demethylubiquinol 3-O-methyltransferase UbiG [Alphaproteobacteria bacterium]|nr:bifunctional 2-polyprenyl-6-hydroxyphenol methylase/3-demethylubiquinol 3-O-methyltransferase UbiG [Alphaproteobacteria bacterium]